MVQARRQYTIVWPPFWLSQTSSIAPSPPSLPFSFLFIFFLVSPTPTLPAPFLPFFFLIGQSKSIYKCSPFVLFSLWFLLYLIIPAIYAFLMSLVGQGGFCEESMLHLNALGKGWGLTGVHIAKGTALINVQSWTTFVNVLIP